VHFGDVMNGCAPLLSMSSLYVVCCLCRAFDNFPITDSSIMLIKTTAFVSA